MTTIPTDPSEQLLCAMLSDVIADRHVAEASLAASTHLTFAWTELDDTTAEVGYTHPAPDPDAALTQLEEIVAALMATPRDLDTQLRLSRCRDELTAARHELTKALT